MSRVAQLPLLTMSNSLLISTAICGAAVIGEVLFIGRDGQRFMKSLRQPSFAPPMWLWTLIGLGYYAICFVGIYRLSEREQRWSLPMGLLIAMMAANTFWNYLYFRKRDLRLVFWYSAAYTVLPVALVVSLVRVDAVAALGFLLYVLYLPYALLLFHATWKLNAVHAP